ncbi:uncharacterized protein LOC122133284 [Clupea harengus]|uniref:Uncharacterized protein LOC122133284 n=1 Tax=Clupea harengus TaxID=7950 RepID=A0A8M1KRN5_CLUHA|nr:uncharacterized protein LOC122133284 [Clupea harengus]
MVCLFQGGSFPFECLDQNVQLTFPAAAFESNGTAQVRAVFCIWSIYEAFRKFEVLFENDTMPNSWDQKKTDDFRNIVYRLVEENECVLNSSQAIEDDFSDREILLDAYFKEMADLLLQKVDHIYKNQTLKPMPFMNCDDYVSMTFILNGVLKFSNPCCASRNSAPARGRSCERRPCARSGSSCRTPPITCSGQEDTGTNVVVRCNNSSFHGPSSHRFPQCDQFHDMINLFVHMLL